MDELVRESGGPGATAHGAAPWDTAGYDGTGIRVGVIDSGFSGYSALIGAHVPKPEAVRCWTSKMAVQHDSLADCQATWGSNNHGTAVTEMLFDVAPGATYYLASILHSSHAKEAVDWLIEKDVDVINMSLAFAWNGPGDGTSPYSHSILNTVDNAVDRGALFSITAGNQGDSSWFGELEDSDSDNVLEFSTGDECNLVALKANESYRFDLRWNDVWLTASTDLDTRLTGPGGVGAEVASSERSQDGTEFSDPFERISYTPTVAGDYCFVVEIQSRHTIPTWAQFQVDSNVPVDVEHTTNTHSIDSPGDTKNAGALTVGAAPYDATSTITTHSGRGPLPDGTIKPDIVGAHGISSQAYGYAANGTSFSAPHVAGLAAVVKERFPDYTPSETATYLKDNALARGAPTPNNTWGHGFAHLPANPPSQPVVTGRAEVGQALTVNISAITDGDGVTTATADSSFSVQWVLVNSDNVHKDIDKATSSTYTISSGDRMHRIRARVSFTDDAGNDEVTNSEATNVVNSDPTGILDIDGTARIGRTLTAHVVKVEDPDGVVEPYSYQWVRVDSDDAETVIPTATSSTYRLIDADAGHRIKYKLSFTDGIDNTETLDSELTTTVGPNLLVGNTGQTTSSTSYVSILPATASTPTKVAQSFTTGSEDNYLITSLNAFVSTGTPTAEIWDDSSGTPGKMIADLTNLGSIPSGTVPDQLIKFSAADVSLDRETTYWVLFTLDSGEIRVRTTTLTDEDDGSEEKWAIGNDFSALIHEGTAWEAGMSDQSESGPLMIQVNGVVLNSNAEPVGDLLLSGAAQVGEALTVDVSNVRDPNGLADAAFKYQWVRIDGATETDIDSATGTSYTLTAGDEGKRIKVEVTYTDDAGYDESLLSVTTQPVRPQDGIGIMVANLYQESSGTTFADANSPHLMQAFDTGDNADGYTLNGVRVGAIAWDDGVNPVVSITEDDVYRRKSSPGPVLYNMATTTPISTDKDNPSVDVDFAAGDVYLDPNTRYWVQFFFPGRGAGSLYVGVTREDDDDSGAAPGWTIADFHTYTYTSGDLEYNRRTQLRIAVLGKAGAGDRPSEGQPAISGEAQVNKVLTADTAGITDVDGLTMATYTYQWVRVDGATDTDITDATSQTYTLAEDDRGKRIRVEVSFSDDRSHSAELSSRATQPVRPESGDGIQVSNAGQDTADILGVAGNFPLNAVSFTTGGHSAGYSLTSVRVAGIVNDDGADPEVFLYGDASGVPGMELHTLKVPSDIPTGNTADPAPAELTADSAVLTPHTTYWVVFKKPVSTESFFLRFTDSAADDFGAASGWSLGDELAYQPKDETNWEKGGFVDHLFLLQITVKADLVTVPGAPASLNATPGDTQVSLTWTAPTSDGGSAVTGYQYRYKTSGEFPDSWTDVPDGSDTGTDRSDERSYTVAGLDNGVEHTFQVRAVNVVGDGAPASATSTPVTTPTLPLSLDVIAGDDVVNIAEKAAGFVITGDTWSVGGASVAVTIGSGTLTATSAPSGAWTVTVPPDASYVTGASVDITVNATLTGYNAAVELTSTLAVDLVRPVLQTAEVSGTTLSLDYSEGLDGSSSPAADAYTVVRTDSSSMTSTVGLASVDPVQVSGSVVALTLDTAVPPGDTVTVGYTVPTGLDAMPVRDTAGNAVEALDAQAAANVPGAPASLNGAPGDTQVSLAWTAPTSDGGSAVTGYEYRYKTSGEFPDEWTDVPDGSDTGADRSDERSYTVTGLDNGVEHTFEVRAVNVVGNGAPASATSTPMTVPGAHASLMATAGDTQVSLTWTVPTSDGGSAVTGYQYRYKTSGEFPDSWTDVPDGSDTGTDRSDERSYTVTGLDNGVEHTFEVRAVNTVGEGAPATATSTPMTTPTLPLSLDVIAGDDVVNISEKAGGFAITGDTGSAGGVSVTVTIGSGTLTATSAPSGAWSVSVPADASYIVGASVDITVNATSSGYNAAVELTSTLAVDLARPVLQTAEVSGTSLELGYSEGLDGSSTPPADAYTVVRTDSSSMTSTVGLASVDPVQVSGSEVALTLDTAVPPGDTVTVDYTVPTGLDAMPLRDTAGNAVEALVAHAVPNVPGAPASVEATAGDTQVTLSWTVPGSDGGSAVTEYQYRYKTSGEFTDSWTDVPDGSDTGTDRSDERSYTVAGLDNGVEHTFQVRAVNGVGDGAPATTTSTPMTVPGAPASLNATAGDTQVTLDWTAPTSDGGSAVTGYQYRYKTSGEFPDEWTGVPDGSDTGTDRSDERSYTVTGLDNGVEHTFQVRAVNVVGDGAPATATATATPLPAKRTLWPQVDETSTRENIQVMIPVLTNDASQNKDSLEVISVTQPMNGTASLTSAISLVKYTPNDGFTGEDSFTYTVSDGLETATAAVRIAVEASVIDGDENQEWVAIATTTRVAEGGMVNIDLMNTNQEAIVSEGQSLFATLQIGRLEGTVDEGNFQVEDSDGEILEGHTITPTIHHNGGWIHGLRWFPGKSVGSFRIRAKEKEDSGSDDEYLVYWVYVEGLLVGSDVITIDPGT